MNKNFLLKRLIDIIGSLIILVILAPILGLTMIFVKMDSKGPVFLKQKRVGKNGDLFLMYKFRTMIPNAAEIGLGYEIAEDDPRLTRIGKFLRRWSLDEIPQLINVLKGDMGLVGPRPALPHQVDKYSKFERIRLNVKPGITGWAQVNGRNLLSWKERINLDVWYVENWSLWLDLKILLSTVRVVLLKEGLYGKEGIVRDYE
ncbi:MAG TPA: sugar transferase [bacterium (Candidatus Stahlbacteria)]|nr:sugar transferase [Candidatus Stahlbacteria bacterium]